MKKRLKTEPILLITHKLIWSAVSAQRGLCVLFVKCAAFEVITWHISSEQHRQTRTQTKKRWGPALWLWKGLVALARAKLRKQQSKIRLHKEKRNYQSKHGTSKSNCIAQSNISKSRMHKRRKVHHIINFKLKMCRPSTACGVLTDNIAERR